MPEITRVLKLKITPEQFLDSCSEDELKEIDLLIQSPRYVNKMRCKNSKKGNDGLKSKKEIPESTKG
jgi:hypothetical protein